jgi:Tfp pilus assembly PilM family ATPase
MARLATGIDVGLRTAKLIRGFYKGNTFHVKDFAVARVDGAEVTDGWDRIEPGFKPTRARVGLTGRDVNVRYTRVPRVPDWQLRNLMRFEVEEIGDQSGSGVASDFNLLSEIPEIEGEDVVLLAMARESLLEAHAAGLGRLGGRLESFAPNSLALYNAYLRYGVVQDDTVLIANVGHDNLDVVIARGPDLLFARNLSGGSRLFEDAIAQRFGVSPKKAEEIKIDLATLEPGARYADANQEKASRAILGAAGQLLSLLQSAVLFCKTQIKVSGLKVDRVLLCGGGAALRGLPQYLSSGMGVPVELFDPFRVVDVSALDPAQADLLEEYKLEAVVALGLATMGSDPGAYSIEILPERVRRRRELLGSTAFLIAAGLAALAFLGYDAWHTSRSLDRMSGQARTLNQELKRAGQTDRRTRELVERNAGLAGVAVELWTSAGAGEQVARVLRVLDQELPEDFWIARLSSDTGSDPDLGIERDSPRPIVHVEGRAREGTASLATLYEGFLVALRERLPGAGIKETLSPDGTHFTIDLSMFGPGAGGVGEEAAGGSAAARGGADAREEGRGRADGAGGGAGGGAAGRAGRRKG